MSHEFIKVSQGDSKNQVVDIKNIKPRDVVLLGLCSQSQFNDVLQSKIEEKATETSKRKKVVKKIKK